MRRPRRNARDEAGVSAEDTQEMFTQGAVAPEPADDETYEDEYDDWDDEYPEDFDEDDPEPADQEGDVDGDGTVTEPSRADELKRRLEGFGGRMRALWTSLLKRAGDIRLPNHELDGQKALVVSGIIIVALLVGTGGYLIGKGTGDDIDEARLEGEAAGRQAGAIAGATRGYAAGFKKGRDAGFEKAYSSSYRRNYRRAYENAGFEVPDKQSIEVPQP